VADIETSVAITAQTDDLQSGMQSAANSVEAATEAMRAQFAGLGAAAQQAQSHIGAAAAQIGSTISALQAKAAGLAGSMSGAMTQSANAANARGQAPAISVTQQSGGNQQGSGSQNRAQEWRSELQSQLSDEQAFFSDSKAEELAFWQDKLALTEAGSKEQLAVENNIYQLEKQLAVQNERDTLASLDADEKVTDAAYARKKAAIEEEAELGKTSASGEIAQLKDLLDSEWALEQDYYEKKLAAAADDARTQEKLTAEEELAYEKYLTDKDKLDAQAVQNSQKQWESLLQPIQRALDTSITGIIMGTTTVQKALSNLAQSIVAEFVNSAVQSVFGGLGKLLGASLVGGGGSGVGGSGSGDQDFSGGTAGPGGESAGGGGLLSGAVGSLFGDIFKGGLGALVGNPFASGGGGLLGGSLAGLFGGLGGAADQDFSGAVGGAAGGGLFSGLGGLFAGLGGLLGFEHGGIVPSAAGGWSVPQLGPGGVLANLHSNEMVLPANISQGLQGMIAGGGATGGGGHTFNIGISAMDAGGVSRLFMSNGSQMVSALNKALRNGSSLYQG
jgi:hypothetical protein